MVSSGGSTKKQLSVEVQNPEILLLNNLMVCVEMKEGLPTFRRCRDDGGGGMCFENLGEGHEVHSHRSQKTIQT